MNGPERCRAIVTRKFACRGHGSVLPASNFSELQCPSHTFFFTGQGRRCQLVPPVLPFAIFVPDPSRPGLQEGCPGGLTVPKWQSGSGIPSGSAGESRWTTSGPPGQPPGGFCACWPPFRHSPPLRVVTLRPTSNRSIPSISISSPIHALQVQLRSSPNADATPEYPRRYSYPNIN